jgi:cytochrome o ubiquinol oxidase subunit 2
LIVVATILMLLIVVPVMFLVVLFAWRYRQNGKATETEYDPEWHHSTKLELVIWSAPLLIIIALGALTWITTHKLDPYRPLDRISEGKPLSPDVKPLEVEVVSLDWKWLFFLPEQGIATVNELAAPVDRPIRFKLTSTHTMNAFYVPDLAGMIYTMPGMETQLNAVINKPGTYKGMSSHYSGAGFAGMTFKFHGLSDEDFEQWVAKAKADGKPLSRDAYRELAKPSERDPVQACMHEVMAMDASKTRANAKAGTATESQGGQSGH